MDKLKQQIRAKLTADDISDEQVQALFRADYRTTKALAAAQRDSLAKVPGLGPGAIDLIMATFSKEASAAASHPHKKALDVPQPATSRSCALGSKDVKTDDKFPHVGREYNKAGLHTIASMKGTVAPCSLELPDAVLQLVIQHLFERVLTVVDDYSFDYEAGVVQLLREAFHECCRVLGLTTFKSCLDASVAGEVEIEGEAATGANVRLGVLFGMEWWLHLSKALKGQMELHFMKQLDADRHVFIGAVEVGLKLVGAEARQKVNQAEKELLAMSFYNALRGAHHDVWVVLTDGEKFVRMHYTSHNQPGSKYHVYQEGMACNQIYGEFRCTNGVQLWTSLPECGATATTAEAVLVMLGGLLDSELLAAHTSSTTDMQAQAVKSQQAVKKRALEACETAMSYKKARVCA